MQTRKTPPQVSDPEVNQALQQVYLDMNTLSEEKGAAASSTVDSSQGIEGSIRAIKQGDNSYIISVKTSDGWVNSQPGHFTFQDKKG